MHGLRFAIIVCVLSIVGARPALAGDDEAIDAGGAPDPSVPADRLAIQTGLTRRQGRRIVHEVRLLEGAIPIFEEAIRRTARDGTEDVVGLYRVSRFELCVRGHAPPNARATRAARAACRSVRGLDAKLVHVKMARGASEATADAGGPITVLGSYELGSVDGELSVSQLRFLTVGRERDLVLFDALVTREEDRSSDERGDTYVQIVEQQLRVFDANMDPVLELTIMDSHETSSSGAEAVEVATRGDELVVAIPAIEHECGDDDGLQLPCYRRPARRLRFRFDAAARRFAPV